MNHTKKISSLTFEVKWTGYDEENNTWEPWKSLRDTEQLHDYLYKNGLASLVPREHKRG